MINHWFRLNRSEQKLELEKPKRSKSIERPIRIKSVVQKANAGIDAQHGHNLRKKWNDLE